MENVFGVASTTEDVLSGVNLHGKRVFVTGVSAGLGVETARSLAAHGARVVGAARDLAKAEAATIQVRRDAAAHGGSFELVVLGNRIAPLFRTGGRLITLSSSAHRVSNVDLEDPNFDQTPYEPFVAYARSKTANILFALGFDRRHRQQGVRATAVHPGAVQTELARHMSPSQLQAFFDPINEQLLAEGKPLFQWKTIPQGSATTVWAGIVAPADEVGGWYCEDCHLGQILPDNARVSPIGEGVRAYALDVNAAELLWQKSEQLVGESFEQSGFRLLDHAGDEH